MTALEVLRPFASHNAQQRGWDYVDRVTILDGDVHRVDGEVEGTYVYDVSIAFDRGALRVSCSCPYFSDSAHICKHLWATAAAAAERQWLTDVPANVRVVIGLDDLEDHEVRRPDPDAVYRPARQTTHVPAVPRRDVRPPAPWVHALNAINLVAHHQDTQAWGGGELLYIIGAPSRATLAELPISIEKREPKRDGTWGKPQPARLTRSMIDQLPDADDRWALMLMNASSSFPHDAGAYGYGWGAQPFGTVYLKAPLVDLLLPRLCGTGRVYFRRATHVLPNAKSDVDLALEWWGGDPWRLRLIVTRNEVDITYRVDAALYRGDQQESIHRFALLTDNVAILDGAAMPFDAAGGFTWARELRTRGAFEVPAKSRAALVASLIATGVEYIDLPEELQWHESRVAPRFSILIGTPNPRDLCDVEAFAEYDDLKAPLDRSDRLMSEDGKTVYLRDRAAERDAIATLKRFGVGGTGPLYYGQPSPGASISAKRVPALVQALVARHWHVAAEGVRYRTIAAPRVHISSGIDWFELEAKDESGEDVDLPALLKAVKEGKRTIPLGDGSIGMLPEEWLARVAPLLTLGDVTSTGVRFKLPQVAVIDALLAEQPAVDWDEGFTRAREAVRRFEGVRAEDPPATFQGVLREYQRESLGWMRFLREFGFGGCLADDMGLGKTVMVLAMLEARRVDRTRAHKPSLVVLPRSLLFNWTSEAMRFVPGLRLLDFAHAARHEVVNAIADADLVLTTYGTLRRDVTTLKDVSFDYVILDEAQAIKNSATATAKAVRLLRADHRLALTGTPVENHLGELQSLFDFLNPGLLGRGGLLDTRKLSSGDAREHVERLARGLRPFFLRRTKEHVAPELPARTEETLYCELEGTQRATYLELRDHYRRVLLKTVDRQGLAKSKLQILEALLRLRQAACHPGLLPRANRDESSAKFDLLLPRLEELRGEGRKALVFSQFTSLLALLRKELEAIGVTYEYLDGQTVDRAERVARFQADASCPLFLISLKAGGVGLNLTAAEYVFLLDPWWNPAVEAQAIDRTHRIGQSKPVFAYRLVARDTVEERILELQARKRELADAILEAGTGGLRGLQREDLEALLS